MTGRQQQFIREFRRSRNAAEAARIAGYAAGSAHVQGHRLATTGRVCAEIQRLDREDDERSGVNRVALIARLRGIMDDEKTTKRDRIDAMALASKLLGLLVEHRIEGEGEQLVIIIGGGEEARAALERGQAVAQMPHGGPEALVGGMLPSAEAGAGTLALPEPAPPPTCPPHAPNGVMPAAQDAPIRGVEAPTGHADAPAGTAALAAPVPDAPNLHDAPVNTRLSAEMPPDAATLDAPEIASNAPTSAQVAKQTAPDAPVWRVVRDRYGCMTRITPEGPVSASSTAALPPETPE